MKFFISCFSLIVLIFPFNVKAQDKNHFSGIYKSLDGQFEHHFSENGDYHGFIHNDKTTKTYQGVYKFDSSGVCFSRNTDGSSGISGNVYILFDDTQCCMRFERISDKVAVTFLGSSPDISFHQFGICRNQVLKKQ